MTSQDNHEFWANLIRHKKITSSSNFTMDDLRVVVSYMTEEWLHYVIYSGNSISEYVQAAEDELFERKFLNKEKEELDEQSTVPTI